MYVESMVAVKPAGAALGFTEQEQGRGFFSISHKVGCLGNEMVLMMRGRWLSLMDPSFFKPCSMSAGSSVEEGMAWCWALC